MSFSVENFFQGLQSEDVIFSYKGDISSDVINHILDSVEKKTVEINDPSKIRKKVYNVLVESLQNLYHHVDTVPEDFEDQSANRFGLIVINRNEAGYYITAGNFISTRKVNDLKVKILKINNSTAEEIKELYKYILHHQKISDKGGGGLGLVDIARKTGNKLEYSFSEYNNKYSFFIIRIKIDKTPIE
ncbi:MAG TPA: SiaB family protein kinase [Bacteroidales bacterium]|nr:SiaB family protein kinase [Bacteroidales bacterium]